MMSGMAAASTPRTGLQRFKRVLPVMVVLAILVGSGFVWQNLVGWLATPDRKTEVDVIVVPAGELNKRVEKAIGLLDRELASEVWVVLSDAGDVLREPDAIREYADTRDHGDDVTVLKKRSRNLVRDARLIAAQLRRDERKQKVQRDIAVVTSPLEVSRTRLVFERETGDEVLVWRDSERFERRWQSLVQESAKILSTLAVLGAGNEL